MKNPYCKKKLNDTISKLIAELEAKMNDLDAAIAKKTEEKFALEQKLSSASFFAFGLKKQLNFEIETTKSRLEELSKEKSEFNTKHQEKMEIEKDKILKEIDKLPKKANLKFPMPK